MHFTVDIAPGWVWTERAGRIVFDIEGGRHPAARPRPSPRGFIQDACRKLLRVAVFATPLLCHSRRHHVAYVQVVVELTMEDRAQIASSILRFRNDTE